MTYPEQLRRLANWLETHEVHDVEVIRVGVENGGMAVVTVRHHAILKAYFPGREAKAVRGATADILALTELEDGIKFEAWQTREAKPVEPQLVVL